MLTEAEQRALRTRRSPFRADLTNDGTYYHGGVIAAACKQSDLVCHAKAIKRGKELIFTEITATDADGKVVAHGVQTYRIV
jgi:acyl-coenzyme A thioesterase PaaI-like protein